MDNIQTQINTASKWSMLTEIVSKLLPPVTNMILARLLAPEAFGMVATITMVTSFAEIFADAGFQKYLVQHDFADMDSLDRSTNVAFWSNLSVSLTMWLLIIVFRNGLASAVGSPGLGTGIAVAAMAIPLTSFSSIQVARYRRNMDFRGLFFARLVGIFVPLFVTVPLAFILRSYWALVIGNLTTGATNAVFLTVRSTWKPRFYYNFAILKEMLGFSLWMLVERLLGWANLNIGIFIVGVFLSEYYLGLYKTSMAYVNQVLDIIVNSFSPVLLSALSRMREKKEDIRPFFYQFEEKVGMFIIPLGIGIFIFRNLFTQVLLGGQWTEAAGFIGLWALVRAFSIVFSEFSITLFISVGKPKFAVAGQVITLLCLLPILLFSAPRGYETLYIARSLAALFYTLIYMALMKLAVNASPLKITVLSLPYFLAAALMGAAGELLLGISQGVVWQLAAIVICMLIYFALICLYPRSRNNLLSVLRTALKRNH